MSISKKSCSRSNFLVQTFKLILQAIDIPSASSHRRRRRQTWKLQTKSNNILATRRIPSVLLAPKLELSSWQSLKNLQKTGQGKTFNLRSKCSTALLKKLILKPTTKTGKQAQIVPAMKWTWDYYFPMAWFTMSSKRGVCAGPAKRATCRPSRCLKSWLDGNHFHPTLKVRSLHTIWSYTRLQPCKTLFWQKKYWSTFWSPRTIICIQMSWPSTAWSMHGLKAVGKALH